MFYLAGIGGRVSTIINSAKAARSVLAIDGCPLDCTKRTLEVAAFTRVNHLRLNDLGFEKGKTKVSSESVAKYLKDLFVSHFMGQLRRIRKTVMNDSSGGNRGRFRGRGRRG